MENTIKVASDEASKPLIEITTQHGARSGKNDTWSFLHEVEQSAKFAEDSEPVIDIRSVLAELSTDNIDTLDVLDCLNKNDVIRCFYSLVGYVAGSESSHLNPFIDPAPGKATAESVVTECGQLPHPLTKQSVEDAFRIIGMHNLCKLRTMVVILNILPQQSIMEVRRLLARSLEEAERERGWGIWKNYLGEAPEAEDLRVEIRGAFRLFRWVLEEFSANVLSYIKGLIINKGNEDVLTHHSRWKTIKTYIKTTTTRPEMLERERVLFRRMEAACPLLVSWDIRRQHLNRLIESMQLGTDTTDRYLLQLSKAPDYELWLTWASEMLEYAEIKGISLPAEIKGTSLPAKNEADTRTAPKLGNEPRKDPVCSNCHKKGHSEERCFLNKRLLMECSICHKKGHSEERCFLNLDSKEKENGKRPQPLVLDTAIVPADVGVEEVLRPMVEAEIRDGDEIIVFNAALDSCSSANFISGYARKRLRTISTTSSALVSIGTITQSGNEQAEYYERITLEVSLTLNDGSKLPTSTALFYVIPGRSINGGGDLLLSSQWILEHRLWITGAQDDRKNLTVLSSAVTIEEDEISVEDDIFEEDDIELAIKIRSEVERALGAPHLTPAELAVLSDGCAPIPVTLHLKEGADHPPCIERGYPTSDDRVTKLIELLDTLEHEGIISRVAERSGKFLFPGFGVRKGPDKIRLVVNLKGVNHRLEVFDGVQHHDVQTWLSQLPSWAQYYAVLDVKNAFYHLPVVEESRDYLHMSIWTRQGYREYRWQKCPQGLSVAPSWWCEHIERCIRTLLDFLRNTPRYTELVARTRVVLYADDILVAGRDEADTTELSEVIHQFLSYNRMYIPEDKFQRCTAEVQVMGMTLRAGTVSLGSTKARDVLALRKPRNRKELSSALGLLNYVRHWQQDRLNLGNTELQHLFALRDSRGTFNWESRHDEAWSLLVDRFQNLPLQSWSTIPAVEENTTTVALLVADASDLGIGYACFVAAISEHEELMNLSLQQLAQDDRARLVLAGSRRLTTAERNYVSFDKEGLAVFTCLSKARPYILLAERSIVLTDSTNALVRMLRTEQEPSLTRGRRWIRWLNDLSDILLGPRAVVIQHIAGEHNLLADYLSRYALQDINRAEKSTQTETEYPSLKSLDTRILDTPQTPLHQALKEWLTDEHSEYLKCRIKDIWLHLKGDESAGGHLVGRQRTAYLETLRQVSKRFEVIDDVLYHSLKGTDRIVVPDNKMSDHTLGRMVPTRLALIRHVHESGPLACHRGIVQTMGTLRRSYWFPGMDGTVQRWIASCESCQLVKARARHDSSTVVIEGPNHILYMDWAGPFKISGAESPLHVLIMVDGFTMFGLISVYEEKSAINTCDGLFTWCSILGTPLRWSSDNDSTFTSQTIRHLRELLKIDTIDTPAYTPSTEGIVERKVRDLKEGILKFLLLDDFYSLSTFRHVLKCVVWGYNSTVKYGTTYTPFEVMLGRIPYCPLGIMTHGLTTGVGQGQTIDAYTEKLKTTMNDIHQYWQSKVLELRSRSTDIQRECSVELTPNTRCIRVIFVNGRRVSVSPLTVTQRVGTNLFHAVTDSEQLVLVPAYQLVPLITDKDRELFETHTDIITKRRQLILDALRAATPGCILGIHRSPDLYFGQLKSPYVGGSEVSIVYLIPEDRNGTFRFAKTPREINRWTFSDDIDDIVLVDVPIERTSTSGVFRISRDQLGGKIVS